MTAVNAIPRQVEAELLVGDRQDCVIGVDLGLGNPVQKQAVPPAILFLGVVLVVERGVIPLYVGVTSRLNSDLYPTYDVRVFPGSRVSELGE